MSNGILFFICKICGELQGEASGCSTGKDEVTFSDRKSDFGGGYLSAEALHQFDVHEVGKDSGLESGGIRIDKEEQWFFLEDFTGEFQEWVE